MSEEENLDYEVVERDLNLEPEKFHRVKQAFRVLAGLPPYIVVNMKERFHNWVEKRKERKAEKKAARKERHARWLNFWKARAQRAKMRHAKIITVSKNFKHEWAMAGMSEEEKEQYRIEHGLVEQQSVSNAPASAPEQPQQSQTTPAPEQTQPEIPGVAQGAYASYLESSKTVATINEQIRAELIKGSAADFELIGKYREQLKTEELNRDNHLEAYLGLISTKTVEHIVPVAETTQVQEEAKPRVSNRLHLGSAAQRVARRGLIARGTPDIIRTMKANVLKAQKQVVLKAKELLEQGKQILQPVEAPEVAPGLSM